MKRIVSLLIFFTFSFLFSQDDKNFFPTEYVLKNSNDTIKAKVRNVGKFSNKKYYFATVLFKMKMKDATGNETWIEPDQLKYIKITDENNITHEYFSSVDRLPKEKGLIEIMYDGKNIKWYKDYHNPTLRMQLEIMGYIVDNNKNILYSGYFNDVSRKFKTLFAAYPDLVEKAKAAKTEQDYVGLLRIYDDRISK